MKLAALLRRNPRGLALDFGQAHALLRGPVAEVCLAEQRHAHVVQLLEGAIDGRIEGTGVGKDAHPHRPVEMDQRHFLERNFALRQRDTQPSYLGSVVVDSIVQKRSRAFEQRDTEQLLEFRFGKRAARGVLHLVELIPVRDQIHDARRNGLQQRTQIGKVLCGKERNYSGSIVLGLRPGSRKSFDGERGGNCHVSHRGGRFDSRRLATIRDPFQHNLSQAS